MGRGRRLRKAPCLAAVAALASLWVVGCTQRGPPPEACGPPSSGVPDGGAAARDRSWIDGLCHHVCDESAHLCEGDPYQEDVRGEPWSDSACLDLCTTRIAENVAYIANFHCHAPDCEGQWACFEAMLPVSRPRLSEVLRRRQAVWDAGSDSAFEYRGSMHLSVHRDPRSPRLARSDPLSRGYPRRIHLPDRRESCVLSVPRTDLWSRLRGSRASRDLRARQ